MARTTRPAPEPKLGAYELETVAKACRHLNDWDGGASFDGPISVSIETITPNVTAWLEYSEDEGWVFGDWAVT